jgi:glycosyltransferase involved in cell wall biosynthesis
MKIAMISNNSIPVPPSEYGGTQREIYYLTEELVRSGHEVILFAKKGSIAKATATYVYPYDDKRKQLEFIMRHLPKDVDIIHDHCGLVAKSNPPIPTIRSYHGARKAIHVQIPVYVSKTILQKYGENEGYYLHNGIRLTDYRFRQKKKNYLLYIGRIEPMKGVHLAIEVAKKTGLKLLIAGPYDHNKVQKKYFNEVISPQLNKQIRYIGSVGGEEKQVLLSKARCVLFPSVWDEPFGIVMIEALACGTPVLGFQDGGAVPEVLHGLPQLICRNTKDMVTKVLNPSAFPSAHQCRQYVEYHYSERVMVDKALSLYRKILKGNHYKIYPDSEWNNLAAKRGWL